MSADLSTLGEAALELARCGFAVFPCEPRGKKPLVEGGFKRATRDPQQIEAWWRKWPDANVAIATGAASGVVVIDIDGEAGEQLLAELAAKHGELPLTDGVRTGRGRHLYFALPEGCGPVPISAGGGVDVRGDGGYVVAPPSVHETCAVYAWASPGEGAGFVEAPAWLIDFARNRKATGRKAPAKRAPASAANRTADGDSQSFHAALSNVAAPAAPPPETQAEIERVISALQCIPAVDRDIWLRVGMALHWSGWTCARQIWDAWSRTAPDKFEQAAQDKAWASFARPYSGERTTLATIYAKAKERGWADPASPLAAIGEASRSAAEVAAGAAPLIAPKAGIDFARFPRTDAGNSEMFLALYGENVRFVEAWGSWLVWSGARWAEKSALAMMPLAIQTAREMLAWAVRVPSGADRDAWIKQAIATERDARLSAMLKLASSRVIVKPDALDADRWLLGCPNGTLDLRAGKLREARREDFITKQISVAFDPAAECPQWLRFLDWAMRGDRDAVAFLQRFAGYALTGEVREEVLCVFVGGGENGKTTLLATLVDLMGDYGGKASSDLLLHAQGKGGAASPDVAALHGKRLVAVSETEDGGRLSEARVKDIVSNERINARRLHRDPFEFSPSHKIILATNYRPRVHGTDHGIWRRLAPLRFGATVGEKEKDTAFRDRVLMRELAGILSWAVAGCLTWQRGGLRLPATVLTAAAEYRSNEDQVGQWAEERVVLDPAAATPFDEVYLNYAGWVGPLGRPFGKQRFGEELDRLGFASVKLTGGRRARRGLILKPLGLSPGLRAEPAPSLAAKLHVVN